MPALLIIYASTTGNTELMAEAIAHYLKKNNHTTVIKSFDFDPLDVEELLDYDAILIGSHTWDDGELPYEVEDFYEEVEEVDLTGKVCGVFGSCDSFYETYGGAVDLLGDRLQSLGAALLPERLKVDLEPDDDDIKRCEQFAQMAVDLLQQRELAAR